MDSIMLDSMEARLKDAKAFLIENPDEKITHVADKFKLRPKTLYSSITRDKKPIPKTGRGGKNKILEEHQVKAVHHFVRSLLAYGIQPSPIVVFNAIVGLKRVQSGNPHEKGPSTQWFRTWWKENGLHKIKTKPLATVRFTAAQEIDVKTWFREYRQALETLQIKDKKNLINFDEAGFRVGCMKGHQILVPKDVSEFYAVSPENRKLVTIFECIDAAGSYPPPPLVVIQGQDVMVNWFPEGLPPGTRVIPSDNGFTTDKIAVEFIKHYIENSNSEPEADWKLMLMDNHGSHCTPEFMSLANDNHIRPYPLISHLTYCMQPLDVGVFQPYKHWHDMAIQDALEEFSTKYTLSRFLRDLTKIRDQTFRPKTIEHAFRKSRMYPPDAFKCIEQLKTFAPDIEITPNEPKLPLPRVQPATIVDVEAELEQWQEKIERRMMWSDPAQPEEFQSFVDSSKQLFAEVALNDTQLSIYKKRRLEDLQVKSTARKQMKPSGSGLGFTKEQAEAIIAKKNKEEEEAEIKKQRNAFLKIWRAERDSIHAAGLIARSKERARVQKVKQLQTQHAIIPAELLVSIPDPEAFWKATDVTWLALEEAKKAKKEGVDEMNNKAEGEEDGVNFIIDTQGDSALQQDFLPFDDDGNDSDLCDRYGYE